MDQFIFVSLSHTHFYWYEVGMLKVPAENISEALYHMFSSHAGVTQEEVHTRFLIHLLFSAVRTLIFLARRIQPFLSLVDRGVKFCVLTI